MRIEGKDSHVNVDTMATQWLLLSTTERTAGEPEVAALAVLDVNHARALAAAIEAGCDELDARAVGL